ncbi:hypothetical protein SAMN04487979_101192 [Flavobacterium sp. ov086]|nr:hypothetical protein SAMN04487979_101192 [Flavobacterium sp. ov086]
MSSFDNAITLTHKNMTTQVLKLDDFRAQKLSKNQQKTVRGGDENLTNPNPPAEPLAADPGKSGGKIDS